MLTFSNHFQVIVHRRKTGRRRAVSKSSGGAGSDTGGSGGGYSRTHSANNLIKSPNYVEISAVRAGKY